MTEKVRNPEPKREHSQEGLETCHSLPSGQPLPWPGGGGLAEQPLLRALEGQKGVGRPQHRSPGLERQMAEVVTVPSGGQITAGATLGNGWFRRS